MKTYEFKKYGNTYQMRLGIETYQMSGNLAIQMYTFDEEDGWELWNTMTVNLYEVPDKNCAFIDTNNNGEMILDWIKSNKLAVPTGNIGFSGYCQYPEYCFKAKALKEMDPEGYEKYIATWKE